MRNIEDLKEWVIIAKSDLDSAIYLSDMKPFPTAIICYHSQQCVEKLLKGFLALNGRPVPETHNLLMLHKSCCRLDEEFSSDFRTMRAAEWLCYRHSLSVF